MGIDLLDFTCRIEKRFGIEINRDDYRTLENGRTPWDLSAGELHDWVVKLCEARRAIVPRSSWTRVKLELAIVVGKPPQIIHRETMLVRDLGFS